MKITENHYLPKITGGMRLVREAEQNSPATFKQAARECLDALEGKLYIPREWDILENEQLYQTIRLWCDTHHVHCFYECQHDRLTKPHKMSRSSYYCVTISMLQDTGLSNPAWMRKIQLLSTLRERGGRTCMRLTVAACGYENLYPISIGCSCLDLLIIEPDVDAFVSGERIDLRELAQGLAAAMAKGSYNSHNRIPSQVILTGWKDYALDLSHLQIKVWNHTYEINPT